MAIIPATKEGQVAILQPMAVCTNIDRFRDTVTAKVARICHQGHAASDRNAVGAIRGGGKEHARVWG